MENKLSSETGTTSRRGWVAGAILMAVGLFTLAMQVWQPAGALALGLIAAVFVFFGLAARKPGLLIPAGIISGVALGVGLVEGPLARSNEMLQGGAFFLSVAGGFVLISLLTLALRAIDASKRMMTWPLIPAFFIALFGGLVASGSTQMLEWVGKLSPLGLVLLGLILIIRRK